jgi:hypothetical protein
VKSPAWGTHFRTVVDRALQKLLHPALWLQLTIIGVVSARVLFWLPVGFSPDNANSFSPVMPISTNPLTYAFPWVSVSDGGYANPSVASFVGQLPQFFLSWAGLSTWTAQEVWLFFLYFVGSVLVLLAAGEVIPELRNRPVALTVAAVAYQLAPGLIYGLQDTAAYGLLPGFYWGIPLIILSSGKLIRSGRWIWGLILGASTLLFASILPAGVVLIPFLLIIILIQALSRSSGQTRSAGLVRVLKLGLPWVVLCNIWWVATEAGYASQFTTTLGTNAPLGGVAPSRFAAVILMNWSNPTAPPYLVVLGAWWYVIGLAILFVMSYGALLRPRPSTGLLSTTLLCLVLLVGITSYSLPFGEYYVSILNSSPWFYLIRNPTRFAFLYVFLWSILLGAGFETWSRILASSRLQFRWTRRLSQSTIAPRFRLGLHSRSIGVTSTMAALCAVGLVLGGLPLITGDVLTNTNYTGTSLLPASPAQRGVEVPSYYASAHRWLASTGTNTTTYVAPMPGTWLSALSGTTWGYEGGSSIYLDLLKPPLILNDAGTSTAPEFSAVADSYSIAASGGPPGSPVSVPTSGSLYLWPGYVGDNISRAAASSVFSPLTWTINGSLAWGSNGHQFQLGVSNTSSNASYLSVAVDAGVEGTLGFTWGINGTDVGWYYATIGADQKAVFFVPLNQAPPINYDPSRLNVSEFPRSTTFTFQFIQASTGTYSAQVLLQNLTTYSSMPSAFTYYLRSLGVDYLAFDKSITSRPPDNIQNWTSYLPVVNSMQADLVQTFGPLSFYKVPDPAPTVGCVADWSAASSYVLAASEVLPDESPYFVVSPPNWVPSENLQSCNGRISESSPSLFQGQLMTGGPTIVALLQNFDPGWQMEVNGKPDLSHFVINGFANAWLINATGVITVEISFLPAYVPLLGLGISLGGGLLLLGVLNHRAVRRTSKKILDRLRSCDSERAGFRLAGKSGIADRPLGVGPYTPK